MQTTMNNTIDFWRGLVRVVAYPQRIQQTIDIPLEDALQKARSGSVWTAVIAAVVFWWQYIQTGHRIDIFTTSTANSTLNIVIAAVLTLIWIPLFYGFFRLYTLITHVITLNVFKNHGQRLRLLNLQTALLPLTVPIAIGSVLLPYNPVFAYIIMMAAGVEAIFVFAIGYNTIFHKQGLQGLLLWTGGTLVTWFVLAIGALAVAVAFGVITLIVLIFMRR